ncbi:MAG: SAP domain-containing protein [Chitinispirillaceae bacterium]
MNLTAVKAKAKESGVKIGKLRKDELIRAIQKQEGNFPCFGSAENECNQMDCMWREDCLR